MTKKVIMITGAGSGIGRELALKYASHSCSLILAGRNATHLAETEQACTILGAECKILELDLQASSDIEEKAAEALKLFGRIDTLINNAGVSQRGDAASTDIKIVRSIMEVNFFGSVALTLALLPELRKNKGRIVVISSFAGLFGFPLRSSYSASKFALNGYFETLGLEEKEVSVTIACPGRIKTQISLNAIAADGTAHGQMDQGQLNGIAVEKCAAKIFYASEKRRKWVFIARGEKLLLLFKKFCPPLFYYTVNRISAK